MPFQKGKSGNPGGRKRDKVGGFHLQRVCEALGPRCIEGLKKLLDDPDPRIALEAMKQILDRGFGKATQGVEVSGKNGESLTIAFQLKDK